MENATAQRLTGVAPAWCSANVARPKEIILAARKSGGHVGVFARGPAYLTGLTKKARAGERERASVRERACVPVRLRGRPGSTGASHGATCKAWTIRLLLHSPSLSCSVDGGGGEGGGNWSRRSVGCRRPWVGPMGRRRGGAGGGCGQSARPPPSSSTAFHRPKPRPLNIASSPKSSPCAQVRWVGLRSVHGSDRSCTARHLSPTGLTA